MSYKHIQQNEIDLDKSLKILGYTKQWINFGIIDEDILSKQISLFNISDDKNEEHYRLGAFRSYFDCKKSFSDTEY